MNTHTVQEWIKFCEGDAGLEDEECSGQPSEVDNWEQSAKLILLHYMGSCPRTQRRPFYGHLAFEANWKGEKAW